MMTGASIGTASPAPTQGALRTPDVEAHGLRPNPESRPNDDRTSRRGSSLAGPPHPGTPSIAGRRSQMTVPADSSSPPHSVAFPIGRSLLPWKRYQPPQRPLPKDPNRKPSLYEKWRDLDLLALLFSPPQPPGFARTIYMAQPLPEDHLEDRPRFSFPIWPGSKDKGRPAKRITFGGTIREAKKDWVYATNQVLTAKYNIFTFLPRNLLEQFRRVANVFFLVLVILQFIPIFTNVSPGLAALPLLVVLAITALKDGYEDVKRHQSDRKTNGIEVVVLKTGERHDGWIMGGLHKVVSAAEGHRPGHERRQSAMSGTGSLAGASTGGQIRFNPNITAPKSRSVKIPGTGWLMRKWGLEDHLTEEEQAVEEERKEKKLKDMKSGKNKPDGGKSDRQRKSWWGKKTIRRSKRIKDSPADGAGEKLSDETTVGGNSDRVAAQDGSNGEVPGTATTATAFGGDHLADKHATISPAIPVDETGRPVLSRRVTATEKHHPHFSLSAWEDVLVGDILLLRSDDSVPADCLILATSEEEDVCYVETKNLDGETNLKSRRGVQTNNNQGGVFEGLGLSHPRRNSSTLPTAATGGAEVAGLPGKEQRAVGDSATWPDPQKVVDRVRDMGGFRVRSSKPDTNLFRYDGTLLVPNDGTGKDLQYPITIGEMLLRGCVIRNTEWVLALALFTGRDTKIVLNSGGTPSKRSRIERQIDPQVFVNLTLLAVMCILCGIGDAILEVFYYNRDAYWTYRDNRSGDNRHLNGFITFLNGMITFQNIVPISLYISIEFVRTIQAAFIYTDDEIKYRTKMVNQDGKVVRKEVTKGNPEKGVTDDNDDDDDDDVNVRRTTAKSFNLSDDLGQVEYIFSDKTGTLTQNAMVFRQCEIGGTIYRGTPRPESQTTSPHISKQVTPMSPGLDEKAATAKALGVPVLPEQRGSTEGSFTDGLPESSSSHEKKPLKAISEAPETYYDSTLLSDLSDDPNTKQSRNINGFFSVLGLCHTVLASEDEEGNIHYKAQSPDEAALVQAAADVGFIFLGRDKNILRIQTPGSAQPDEWELLNVLEFTSARKRMSVVVRRLGGDDHGEFEHDNEDDDGHGRLFLLSKGADSIIFDRLAPGQDAIRHSTDDALEDFANTGLRTLCLAYREIDEDEYASWATEYQHATSTIDDRDAKIDAACDKLEREMQLLGSTAIEDKLQDGVPETIADLKTAGIKVWVATGDKLETAIAIGKTCNLISRDMNLIVIKGGEYGSGEKASAYGQMLRALDKFFNAGDVADWLPNQPPDRLERSPSRASRPRSFLRRPSEAMSRRTSHYGSQSMAPPLQRTNTGVSDISDIVGADNGMRSGGYGLVIDGSSLTHAFAEPWTKDLLLELSVRCKAVVCCRTSPLQKALIVRLVKDGLGALCLAIGDGANDVSMIQAAHVGVGVAGEEGLQAVNSSDYAIAQFRFLKRLLLVHGHLSYYRNSNMIINFFEKEIIGIGILFWFQFYCAFSTLTVYEYTYLLFWNVFWTLFPVLTMGLFDRDLNTETLMQVPQVYYFGRENRWFGLVRFSLYMLEGIIQSLICYFFILYTYTSTTARDDGVDVDIYEFSTVMAIAAVWVTNLWIGLNTRAWNWFIPAGIVIGPILIILWTVIYSAVRPGWIVTNVYGNNTLIFQSALSYLSFLLSIVICLVPRVVYRYIKQIYFPNDIDLLAYQQKINPNHDFANDPAIHGKNLDEDEDDVDSIQHPLRPTGESVELRRIQTHPSQTHDMSTPDLHAARLRGFAFDQAEGVGEDALGRPLRRYTSNLGVEAPVKQRRRGGSIRNALFPALGRTLSPVKSESRPSTRDRPDTLRRSIFRRMSRGEGDRPKSGRSGLSGAGGGSDRPQSGQSESTAQFLPASPSSPTHAGQS